VNKKVILERFLCQIPSRFKPAECDVRLCAVLIDADPATGQALSIQRIEERES
jgi:calcineurin-like phosphoesterase